MSSFSPSSSSSPDAAAGRVLVERLRDGDARALGALMDQYAEQCHRVAYAVVEDRALADDVVQDVFVYLWERRATLDVRENLQGYLLRAARSRALNVIRHERSQRRRASDAAAEHHALVSENAGDGRIAMQELARHLGKVLATVTPRTREIFRLRHEAGLTNGEIAGLLEIGEPTVRNRVSQVTQLLQQAVRTWMTDGRSPG